MSGVDKEWLKAAMADDTMVAELLLRLGADAPAPPPLKPAAALPLEWSVRQRRSKPVSFSKHQKKQAQRASPTTPLSWSGTTSISGGSGGSGGGGGYEESSRPLAQKLSTTARSKVNGDGEKTALKRSRKKKTIAELKDEENSLLKERRMLKRQMAALHMDLEKQRTMNENLKRIKIELQPFPDGKTSRTEQLITDELQQKTTACHPTLPTTSPVVSGNNVPTLPSSNGCPEQDADGAASDLKFALPDLNIPFEENQCPGKNVELPRSSKMCRWAFSLTRPEEI